jgi:hypothetical protein
LFSYFHQALYYYYYKYYELIIFFKYYYDWEYFNYYNLEYIGPYIFLYFFINHQSNYYDKHFYINIFIWKFFTINFNVILMNLGLLFTRKNLQIIITHFFNNLSLIPNVYSNYYFRIIHLVKVFSH